MMMRRAAVWITIFLFCAVILGELVKWIVSLILSMGV